MGNVMRDNIFIGCKQPWALARGVKPEWLTRENNHEYKLDAFPFLVSASADGELDLGKLREIWKAIAGFEPIPVERIGPRGL
jgi:hypothetical protein